MKEKTKSFFSNLWKKIKFEVSKSKDLWRNVPGIVLTLFVVAIICMNLLANKTIISFGKVFALDGGFLVSWLSFLTMDITTKHFGPKAATRLSIVATIVNLVVFVLFIIIGSTSGYWGPAFLEPIKNNSNFVEVVVDGVTKTIPIDAAIKLVNNQINALFKGSMYILISSTIAFLTSAIINNFSNFAVNKLFKKNPEGKAAYFVSTYVSTTVGQFIDNLLFAVLSFMIFASIPGANLPVWGFVQCVTCAATGAIFELLMEIIFSPIGYKVTKKWKKENVGKYYLDKYGKE